MRLLGLLIVGAAIAACGGADDSRDVFGGKVCVPGATTECACPGGAKGAQACRDDGAGYETCQCASGSGGSAGAAGAGGSTATGGTGGSGGASGSGGAGGGCTPRTMCPDPPDGGAPLCGMLDHYCGGKLSCGCDFGECAGSTCSCWRIPAYDQACAGWSGGANGNMAVQCLDGFMPTATCGSGPYTVPGVSFPAKAKCCK